MRARILIFLTLIFFGFAPRLFSEVFRPEKLAEMDAAINRPLPITNVPAAFCGWSTTAPVYEKAYGNRALVPDVEPMTDKHDF